LKTPPLGDVLVDSIGFEQNDLTPAKFDTLPNQVPGEDSLCLPSCIQNERFTLLG